MVQRLDPKRIVPTTEYLVQMDVAGWLAEMTDLQAAIDVLRLQMEDEVAAVYTPEIKAQVKAIEVRHNADQEATQARIGELRGRIKMGVLQLGQTVKGDGAQAIWIKGRVSWDTRALTGYAAVHPEIEQFRKVGKPSVSIRRAARRQE